MKGECEGLFDAASSESFHGSIARDHTREAPLPFIPELLHNRELRRLLEGQRHYHDLQKKGRKLGPAMELLIRNRTRNPADYIIQREGRNGLVAAVTQRYGEGRRTHTVNIGSNPRTCSLGCMRLDSAPCMQACTFAASLQRDP